MATSSSQTQYPIDKTRVRRAFGTESHTRPPLSSEARQLNGEELRTVKREASEFDRLIDGYGNEFRIPDYTAQDIRQAIPKDCFERSAIRGFGYILRDVALLTVTFTLFYNLVIPGIIPSYYGRAFLWTVYGFANGLFATGLWVIAHECGHQSFSTSKILNDTTGFVLHSALLVPYFSWKISHGKHHKGTGHMERDMVFLPKTRSQFAHRHGIPLDAIAEATEDTPLWTLTYMLAKQLLGWPIYLLTNSTGHNYHERQAEGRGKGKKNGWFTGVNHFSPTSPLYENKDAKLILLSDLGIAATATALYLLSRQFGAWNIAIWYGLPYLWVNHWLVAITFLQHTDPSLPHYYGGSWTFVRGAAATIDRDFGFVGRHLFHGIIETHVLHHYVSTIPFYSADRATEAIKPVMGMHYRSDTRGGIVGFLSSLWKNIRQCQWVEHTKGVEGPAKEVMFFRNKNGIGPKPL